MTTTTVIIIVLLAAAIFATVWREFLWADRMKDMGWKHNDRVKGLKAENKELEASAQRALAALTEANLEVTHARLQMEKLVSVDAK